ncbi:GDP-mannose 4,6-dehydratase [Tahibacter caeni]|uniref:GDP-mannose 4,6-dehydratase n=1 Tax=Tahibacter caeni TaxID=1453545 RepID=UPI002147EF5F|nr:GDP-mannose 4,6-dehydratase [Tahibacter caeni]
MSLRVLVTGAAGQDGAYLCRDLLAAGREVHAGLRPGWSDDSLWRLRELGLLGQPRLHLLALDVCDAAACSAAVEQLRPQLLFHLAAVSSVAQALADPLAAVASNGEGTLHLLEALRRYAPDAHFVLASSGEIFVPRHGVVDESCALQARHPYALSKLLAHAAVRCYRDSYGLHASAAILFNHESPLRGAAFVTRKIAAAAARRAAGDTSVLQLGNLDARRDFGYAPDYVAGLRALAALEQPDDLVFASGLSASVRAFATAAYAAAGIVLEWHGRGRDECALDRDGRRCIAVDATLLRPADAPVLRGDATRARRKLGLASSVDLAGLARLLVDAERRRLGSAAA